MKILLATPVPPLLHKPRPHYFIRGLASRGHAVHLLTQIPSKRAAAELPKAPGWREIVESCSSIEHVVMPKRRSYAQCAVSLPTATPLRVAYCRSPEFTLKAQQLIRQHSCDILHVDRERIAPDFSFLPLPKVLDVPDSITLYLRRALRYGPLSERLISAVELLKMPNFEGKMAAGYSACLVTSHEDAQALESAGLQTELEVLPNGVDARLFNCTPSEMTDTLLFVGGFYYPPNADAAKWFTKCIFPRVKAVRPKTQLYLVGHRPGRATRRLARVPGVVVTGTVRDIMPYFERATVFVAPLRIGGGFPNKVAEALAAGVPTVATPAAHVGLPDLSPGTHLLEAKDPEEFAKKILQLLENPDLRNRLREAGRNFMQANNYSWDNVVVRLESVYLTSIAEWNTD
jgi:glycosyltransferase involved in cell wall biosynthesis